MLNQNNFSQDGHDVINTFTEEDRQIIIDKDNYFIFFKLRVYPIWHY